MSAGPPPDGEWPAAGYLLAIYRMWLIKASITNKTHVKVIFLFMVVSLAAFSIHPMQLVTYDDILHHFAKCFRWFSVTVGLQLTGQS